MPEIYSIYSFIDEKNIINTIVNGGVLWGKIKFLYYY